MHEPRRIAIVKPSALGDIVHSLPVLSALRGRFPKSHITWVVNRGFESLLLGHPHLDSTFPFERGAFRSMSSAVQTAWDLSNQLRKQRFDLVIDLQGLLRTGLIVAATGSPRKIGFANAREGATRFYTHTVDVPDADQIHAVDRYWRIVESLGITNRTKQFIVPISTSEQEQVLQALQTCPRPWIAVAPGAKWLTKRWPTIHFSALLRKAQATYGGTILLLGASEDLPLSAQIATSLTGSVVDFVGKTSLPKLIAVLSLVDVMFANDTGPLHLAAALGKPCIAPYTCTRVALHGPYPMPEVRSAGIETAVSCGGSYLKKCPNNRVCFAELTPEKLWPALSLAFETRLKS
jgi:heptosyltransferase I